MCLDIFFLHDACTSPDRDGPRPMLRARQIFEYMESSRRVIIVVANPCQGKSEQSEQRADWTSDHRHRAETTVVGSSEHVQQADGFVDCRKFRMVFCLSSHTTWSD